MAKNTCEYMGNCPTLKTLEETVGRETRVILGSTNSSHRKLADGRKLANGVLNFLKKGFCDPSAGVDFGNNPPAWVDTRELKEKLEQLKNYTQCQTYMYLKNEKKA